MSQEFEFSADDINRLFGLDPEPTDESTLDEQTPQEDFFNDSDIKELFGVDEISDTDPLVLGGDVIDDSETDIVLTPTEHNAELPKLESPAKSPVFRCEGGVCPVDELKVWVEGTDETISEMGCITTDYKLDTIPRHCSKRQGKRPGFCGKAITQQGTIYFEDPDSRQNKRNDN